MKREKEVSISANEKTKTKNKPHGSFLWPQVPWKKIFHLIPRSTNTELLLSATNNKNPVLIVATVSVQQYSPLEFKAGGNPQVLIPIGNTQYGRQPSIPREKEHLSRNPLH